MNLTSVTAPNTGSIVDAALLAEAENLRGQQDTVNAERAARRGELGGRLNDLERGRQELLKAAAKALVGGLASAALQGTAAACQGMSAVRSAQAANTTLAVAKLPEPAAKPLLAEAGCSASSAKSWDAASTAILVGAKLVELCPGSGATNHADKIVFDKQAEVHQARMQEAAERASETRGLQERELARMKDLADLAHQVALAAVRG
jgi:uncharacterized protein YdaT